MTQICECWPEEEAEPDDDPIITPPSRREILTKYPNLYKDFPHLEKAFYREQKYTEIYPTIKHAEAASEKARVWDNLENDLGQGNLSGILNAVATTDKNAFYKMVDEAGMLRTVTGSVSAGATVISTFGPMS